MGKRNMKENFTPSSSRSRNKSSNINHDDKFAVFEFDNSEEVIEMEANNYLSNFKLKAGDPVSKYDFLCCFAQGTKTEQNKFDNEEPYSVAADESTDKRNLKTDTAVPSRSSNHKLVDISSFGHLDLECSPCDVRSSVPRARRAEGSVTSKTHIDSSNVVQPRFCATNKAIDADTDHDHRVGLKLPSSSCSSKQQLPQHCPNVDDIELLVVVKPSYIKFGNIYLGESVLTFSRRNIELKGSRLCDRKEIFSSEWSISNIMSIDHQFCQNVQAAIMKLHLKSYVLKPAEIVDENSDVGIVELEFAVSEDPNWSDKQEAIKSLYVGSRITWNTITQKHHSSESFQDIIYPKGDSDAVFIRRSDVELLQPGTFINDTIVDFYFKYLKLKMRPEEQHRFHFFNSFFFRKLADLDQNLSRTCKGREAFERVQKWTRRINIFEKDYIFIPINFRLHWSLIVVCHLGDVADSKAEEMDVSSKVPCILHMDSIKGSHSGLKNLIRSYLYEEWKARHAQPAESILKKLSNLPFISVEVPQQENFFDCGLFLLHYAELFVEQAPIKFSFSKDSNFPSKDWFHPAEVSLKKRDQIRELIYIVAGDNNKEESLIAPDENNDIDLGKIDMLRGTKGKFPAQSDLLSGSKSNTSIMELQNAEDHVPEVNCASSPDSERGMNKYSSMSKEELAACVVEDSEESCSEGNSRIRNTPRSLVKSCVAYAQEAESGYRTDCEIIDAQVLAKEGKEATKKPRNLSRQNRSLTISIS